MTRYTAEISRNFRDIATGAPKALLRSIVQDNSEDFRDHAWVEVNQSLARFFKHKLPKNGKRVISFEAEEKTYYYRGAEFKKTLINIKNIRVLGKA